MAATLRPETMYGQTNCWVHPDLEYIAFKLNDESIFVCSERAAKNMSYQGFTAKNGEYEIITKLKGQVIFLTINHLYFNNSVTYPYFRIF